MTPTFQARTAAWVRAVFGHKIAVDMPERCNRLAEESVELLQACGMTEAQMYDIVRWVYARPPGRVAQELGGAMVTLAALADAAGLDLAAEAEAELARIDTPEMRAGIRARHRAKPERLRRAPEAPAHPPPELCIHRGADDAPTLYVCTGAATGCVHVVLPKEGGRIPDAVPFSGRALPDNQVYRYEADRFARLQAAYAAGDTMALIQVWAGATSYARIAIRKENAGT